jgi:hypothetical protein
VVVAGTVRPPGARRLPATYDDRGVEHMGESLRSVGAITLFVADPQRSREFYERVFEIESCSRTPTRSR